MQVTLENADEVYDFYTHHEQPRRKARLAHFALAVKFRPKVTFDGDARRDIATVVESGVRVILCANHLSNKDQFVVAGSAWKTPLRPLIGHIRVLAKNELFNNPKQRANVDMMGGIPVFRTRDNDPVAAAAASRRMLAVCIERGIRGDGIAIFPEGTRNDGDPATLLPIASGVGQIAVGIAAQAPVAIVPMGLAYRDGTFDGAHVVLGSPRMVSADESVADVTAALRTQLQATVDRARAQLNR